MNVLAFGQNSEKLSVSVGFFDTSNATTNFRIKSFSGKETSLLKQFKRLCDEHFYLKSHLLCAHNGKEFDFPFWLDAWLYMVLSCQEF